jgi:hypothetical protein
MPNTALNTPMKDEFVYVHAIEACVGGVKV